MSQGMHAQGFHRAIFAGCDLSFYVIVAAETCAAQVLGTVFNPLDGLSGCNRGDHGAYIARVDGYFVAKAPAKIRRNDANAMLRQARNDGEERAMGVRGL